MNEEKEWEEVKMKLSGKDIRKCKCGKEFDGLFSKWLMCGDCEDERDRQRFESNGGY